MYSYYYYYFSFLQDELNVLKIGIKDEMDQFPSLITNVKDLKRKKELENLISVYDEGMVVCLEISPLEVTHALTLSLVYLLRIVLNHTRVAATVLKDSIYFFVVEIQFLEQNYDITKCNIWMRQVSEIQNKVKWSLHVHFKSFFSFYVTAIWFQGLVNLNTLICLLLQCRAIVAEKIVQRFDVVKVPRYLIPNFFFFFFFSFFYFLHYRNILGLSF